MSEPVTQSQYFAGQQQILDKVDEKHRSLRKDMDEHFRRIEDLLAQHTDEDRKVADRVLTIENDRRSGNERRKEDQQRMDRRAGFISTGISMFWGLLLLLFGWFLKKP